MKYFIATILFLAIFSCSTIGKREVISRSTIKLDGGKMNIRDLIEIDGYYESENIFFDDGTYAGFFFKEGVTEVDRQQNLSKSIVSWKEGKNVRWGHRWGVYEIRGDTIIIQIIDKGSILKAWSIYEIRYKVIDKSTLKVIYYKGLSKINDEYNEKYGISPWNDDSNPSIFIPSDSLPNSDSWLKEEKWIWRNESDWREYMKRVKNK